MKPPKKGLSRDEFSIEISAWLNTHCQKSATTYGGWDCLKRKTPIRQYPCYVSLHATEFKNTCAGDGAVEQIWLPLCVMCEGPLDREIQRSCIHEPYIPPEVA